MSIFLSKYQNRNVYKIEMNNIIYFYISNKEYDYTIISTSQSIISYIQYAYNNESASVIFLKTKKRYRNKGFASYLLKISIDYFEKKKIKEIDLDDMSDNAYRLKKNIYIKHGFHYKNEFPYPEMIMKIN